MPQKIICCIYLNTSWFKIIFLQDSNCKPLNHFWIRSKPACVADYDGERHFWQTYTVGKVLVESLRTGDAYMRWWNVSQLNKRIASPLFQVAFFIWWIINESLSQNIQHWNENVVILTKFSSLAALEVVILTTSNAANDENFIKMTTFLFQWIGLPQSRNQYLFTQ